MHAPPPRFGQQTFNFNALETLLLVTSMFILLAGMTFQSGVTSPGSGGHTTLTALVAIVLVGCVSLFVANGHAGPRGVEQPAVCSAPATDPCCCQWSRTQGYGWAKPLDYGCSLQWAGAGLCLDPKSPKGSAHGAWLSAFRSAAPTTSSTWAVPTTTPSWLPFPHLCSSGCAG